MNRRALLIISSVLLLGGVAGARAAEPLVVYSSLDTADPASKAFTKKTVDAQTVIQARLCSALFARLLRPVWLIRGSRRVGQAARIFHPV